MFFFNRKEKNQNNDITFITALLIHAAKIDENFSLKEENIIKKALIKLGQNENDLEKIIQDAKKIEEQSNQILDFTKKVKNMKEKNKIKIIETLWEIIYSNNEADIYETSLMRRLTGLLYVDNKVMGDIKEKIKNKLE